MKDIVLCNDVIMPDVCFGTGITNIYSTGIKRKAKIAKNKIKVILNKDKKNALMNINLSKIVDISMQHGCKCFDTSRAYGASELVLGNTLNKYPRESYFLVTKLCNTDQYNGSVREGLENSLKALKTDYVDLYLMHWPVEGHFIDSWKEMEKLYSEGKCKAIGVCNFNIHHLEELKLYATIMPMVNEVECHPLFTQNELREYCNNCGIQIMAYTSTARMDERLRKTCLLPIAQKYNKTLAQIILRWHQQIGNIPIVNSSNIEHMIANLDINDFSLTESEIEQIMGININSRLRYDPDNCDFKQL